MNPEQTAEPTEMGPLSRLARDGLKLHIEHWPVAQPRGVVVMLHGLTEHARRHAETARRLNEAGWAVLGPHLRGHGLSEGPRGALRQDDDLLHDLATALDLASQCHPGVPRVVLGHSSGGGVAARFVAALSHPSEQAPWARPVDGLILSSPALEPTMGLFQKALLSTMGVLIQDVAMPVVFKPEWVSSDPAIVVAMASDPLVHQKVTPRFAMALVQGGQVALSRAPRWTVPTLVLYAPRDRLISPKACEQFAAALPPALSSIHAFPDLAHDILCEPGRAAVHQAIRQWLDATFPPMRP